MTTCVFAEKKRWGLFKLKGKKKWGNPTQLYYYSIPFVPPPPPPPDLHGDPRQGEGGQRCRRDPRAGRPAEAAGQVRVGGLPGGAGVPGGVGGAAQGRQGGHLQLEPAPPVSPALCWRAEQHFGSQ